jgi:hypothetical protein
MEGGGAGRDPDHWLYRLTAGEWVAAARNELEQARAALARRAVRPGVTYARRAAGMALNATLILTPDPRLGRSYMDHIQALAASPDAPPPLAAAAALLRDTPPLPPELIKLGAPDTRVVDAAETIVSWVEATVRDREGPVPSSGR